jgi:two-component system, NtrC family, sensor kinase
MKNLFILLLFFSLNGFAQNRQDARFLLKQKIAVAKDDTAKVELLNNLAWSYVFIYGDTAIVYAKQGLDLSKKLNYKKGEFNSLVEISIALTVLGNLTSALHYGFENLALCEKMRDSSLLSLANNMIVICYREQENYKEALKYGHRAMNLSKSPNVDLQAKISALGTMSDVYARNNQLDSALYYGLKAEKLSKKWSGLYLTLGNIYLKLKRRDLAFDYYRKGISLAETNLIYTDLVDIYNKLSIEYELIGKSDSSIYYAKKSIIIEGVSSYPEGELRASTQLAKLYEKQGIKDSTIKYLKLSETLREKLFNRQKTREAQALEFDKQLNEQKLVAQNQENQNKIKLYILLVFVVASLIVAFILWRNNQHKQKTNNLLHEKNEEIQSTLSKLKSTQKQLIQSEKLASLGELTAGIAHEIQNPLNFVNNFSELSVDLIKEIQDERQKTKEERDEGLENELFDDLAQNQEKINLHGKRASSIVKGMLEHSRASTGVKELTDINALADEYFRLAYHGLRAKDKDGSTPRFNTTLETHFDKNLPKIAVIPQDIGRVLLNLFNNAFYAVASTSLSHRENYQPLVTIITKTIPLQGLGLIIIKDNGIGMNEATKAKIFQPFFTTKPTGQGTGLGLSLAYDIITKGHGGTIACETIEGEGTTFIVKLPLDLDNKI